MVRVTVGLDNEVYERIKEKDRLLGLRPGTWMRMILTKNITDDGPFISIEGDDHE